LTRPNHTTVVAYLALFIALGAGTAFAAGQLAKNSVGSKQLKKNAVTGAKVRRDAITGAKVKDASLLGADLADGTITGSKVAPGSLTQANFGGTLQANNVTGVALNPDCSPVASFPSGVSAIPLEDNGCRVHFPSSVYNCAAAATASVRNAEVSILAPRTVYTGRNPDTPNDITLLPFIESSPTDLSIDLAVVC
jgi:hypothetical protein